jgi:hypothetical protein
VSTLSVRSGWIADLRTGFLTEGSDCFGQRRRPWCRILCDTSCLGNLAFGKSAKIEVPTRCFIETSGVTPDVEQKERRQLAPLKSA